MELYDEYADLDYTIPAVHRVCNILDLIQSRPDGFTLTHLAEATGFPTTSAHRCVSSLVEREYVVRDPISTDFHLGPAFVPIHEQQLRAMATVIRPVLLELHHELRETVNLGALTGYQIRYLDILECHDSVLLAPNVGDEDYAHCTALGKAILATLEADRVSTILQRAGMPKRTPRTMTSLASYHEALKAVRAQGYALDDGESDPEGQCIAVPLIGVGTPSSISIAVPRAREPAERLSRYAEALTDTARRAVDRLAEHSMAM